MILVRIIIPRPWFVFCEERGWWLRESWLRWIQKDFDYVVSNVLRLNILYILVLVLVRVNSLQSNQFSLITTTLKKYGTKPRDHF